MPSTNWIDRQEAFRNVIHQCPSFAKVLINSYWINTSIERQSCHKRVTAKGTRLPWQCTCMLSAQSLLSTGYQTKIPNKPGMQTTPPLQACAKTFVGPCCAERTTLWIPFHCSKDVVDCQRGLFPLAQTIVWEFYHQVTPLSINWNKSIQGSICPRESCNLG